MCAAAGCISLLGTRMKMMTSKAKAIIKEFSLRLNTMDTNIHMRLQGQWMLRCKKLARWKGSLQVKPDVNRRNSDPSFCSSLCTVVNFSHRKYPVADRTGYYSFRKYVFFQNFICLNNTLSLCLPPSHSSYIFSTNLLPSHLHAFVSHF